MTPDSLATALRTCAAGLYPLEAGVGLLIANGTFLHRDDFTSRFILHSTSTGEDAQMAAVDWDAATAALAAGELPCSSGFSEQCKASWRVGMSQRSRALQECPGPAAADVEDRQRGEGSRPVKPRMSGFCADPAGGKAKASWRFGHSGHLCDRPS